MNPTNTKRSRFLSTLTLALILLLTLALASTWFFSLREVRLTIGDYYYNRGKYELAANWYEKIVRTETLKIDQNKGDRLKYEEDFAKLKSSLKNLLHKRFADNSMDQNYFSILSLAANSTDHFEEIRVYWALLNNSAEALLNIADHLLNLGQADQALEYYRATISRFLHSPDAHFKLAEALYGMGKHSDEALEHYKLGFANLNLQTSLNLGETAYHYAQILSGRGLYSEAISALDKAIIWHPSYPYYTAALAKNYSLLRNYEKAEYWLNETLRISPASGYGYWEYGNYYMQRQMFSEAVLKFQQAVATKPQGPAYYYGSLGSAYFSIGNMDRGIQALQEALLHDPSNVTYRQWLAAAMAVRHRNR